ncbi:MAG: hypothetical protein ACUVWR_14415 [Anaerolineae bacterium]
MVDLVSEGGLMQYDYSKDHHPDLPQLKLMAAAAEGAGTDAGARRGRREQGRWPPLPAPDRAGAGHSGQKWTPLQW